MGVYMGLCRGIRDTRRLKSTLKQSNCSVTVLEGESFSRLVLQGLHCFAVFKLGSEFVQGSGSWGLGRSFQLARCYITPGYCQFS